MAVTDTRRRVVLDTTDLVCPYPYVRAKEALEGLQAGEELELITDNEATVRSSAPALARTFGAEMEVREDGGRWRVLLRKA